MKKILLTIVALLTISTTVQAQRHEFLTSMLMLPLDKNVVGPFYMSDYELSGDVKYCKTVYESTNKNFPMTAEMWFTKDAMLEKSLTNDRNYTSEIVSHFDDKGVMTGYNQKVSSSSRKQDVFYSFEYNDAGKILSVKEKKGKRMVEYMTFTYDNQNKLVSYRLTTPTTINTYSYEYNADGYVKKMVLKDENSEQFGISYTNDEKGNYTSRKQFSLAPEVVIKPENESRDLTYNEKNLPSAIVYTVAYSGKKYETVINYEFDDKGNWVKRITSVKTPNSNFVMTDTRTIEYR